MGRTIFIAFTLMTLGAVYATVTDVGVLEPTVKKSAREGSVHRGIRGVGRSHTGK